MKIVYKPILDINGIDLATGKYNEKAVKEANKIFTDRIKDQTKKAKQFIKNAIKNPEGKIYISGLGRC